MSVLSPGPETPLHTDGNSVSEWVCRGTSTTDGYVEEDRVEESVPLFTTSDPSGYGPPDSKT